MIAQARTYSCLGSYHSPKARLRQTCALGRTSNKGHQVARRLVRTHAASQDSLAKAADELVRVALQNSKSTAAHEPTAQETLAEVKHVHALCSKMVESIDNMPTRLNYLAAEVTSLKAAVQAQTRLQSLQWAFDHSTTGEFMYRNQKNNGLNNLKSGTILKYIILGLMSSRPVTVQGPFYAGNGRTGQLYKVYLDHGGFLSSEGPKRVLEIFKEEEKDKVDFGSRIHYALLALTGREPVIAKDNADVYTIKL